LRDEMNPEKNCSKFCVDIRDVCEWNKHWTCCVYTCTTYGRLKQRWSSLWCFLLMLCFDYFVVNCVLFENLLFLTLLSFNISWLI
jgi:hypothetical protein